MSSKRRKLVRHLRRTANKGRCAYCKMPFNAANPHSPNYPTKDHKVPKSRGGMSGADNLVWACRRCNQEKGDMTVSEYREYTERCLSGMPPAEARAANLIKRSKP